MKQETKETETQSTTRSAPARRRANDPTRKTDPLDHPLPVARETEQEVLSVFLFNPNSIQKAIEAGLTPNLFFIKSHRTIYSAMVHIKDKGWTLSPRSLSDYLSSQHALDGVGGGAFIAQLIDARASYPESMGGLIQQLKDVEYKREALRKGAELQNLAVNGASPAEIEEFLDTIPRTHTTVQSYILTPTGLIYRKPAKFGFGFETERLTNFGAKILSETIEDDGSADERRFLEMEVTLKAETKRIEVPASKFQAMQWPMTEVGAGAIIFPAKADHARCAIQTLSPNVQTRTVYAHTGWRKIGAEWCYLHGGGAISGSGTRTDLSVRLPGALRSFLLPDPATGDGIIGAYQSALEFLDAFPHNLTVPILGAVFASVLGEPDYSVYLTGQSGSFKSEMTALAMSFFGAEFNRLRLPTNWHSTSNSILELGFTAKDALVVIDDFAPNGQKRQDDSLHAKAEDVFRAAGNRAPKGKLGVDHKQRAAKEPRCLYQSSGEDLPKGPSLQARLYILPVGKGDIGITELSAMQKNAKEGKFAHSLATFLSYMARNYEAIKAQFDGDCVSLRDKLTATNKGHSRKPTMMAHLLSAWYAWLQAAHVETAITTKTRDELRKVVWKVIGITGKAQKDHQSSLNPADQFLELVRSALFAGHAYLRSYDDDEPEEIGQMCGWRRGQPMGECIGMVKADVIFLDPHSSYTVANSQGNRAGEGLAVTPTTLWKRMGEQGMIVKAKGRDLKTRMPRSGMPAIALHKNTLFTPPEGVYVEKPDKPDKPDRLEAKSG